MKNKLKFAVDKGEGESETRIIGFCSEHKHAFDTGKQFYPHCKYCLSKEIAKIGHKHCACS